MGFGVWGLGVGGWGLGFGVWGLGFGGCNHLPHLRKSWSEGSGGGDARGDGLGAPCFESKGNCSFESKGNCSLGVWARMQPKIKAAHAAAGATTHTQQQQRTIKQQLPADIHSVP